MSPEPPLDATGIARRQFATVRKGYDPAEVRAYLHEVSDVVGRLQRIEAQEHERAERAENRAQLAEQLDEHRLVELLGEETARVLEAAREAAGDIRVKAEESAARMVREAHAEARAITERAETEATARRVEILAEADALRREAEDEVERRRVEGQIVVADMRREAEVERERMLSDGERARDEAYAAAEQIRASAREQGRRLVGEATAARERVLGDLARRRRSAREQLERLNGARERLLAAYEVVRRTVDEATTELTVALPEARAASEMAMRRVSEQPGESVEVLEAELSVARMAGLVDDLAATAVTDDELDALIREAAEEEAHEEVGAPDAAGDEADAPVGDDPAGAPAGVGDAAGEATEGDDPNGESAAGDDATGDDDAPPGEASTGGDEAAGRGEPAGDVAASTGAGDGDPSPPRTGTDDRDGPSLRAPDEGAATPSPPMSDGDKWGIRLPRSRRATSAAESPGVPGPAPAAAPPAAAATPEDEGESGPYVDALFARIRAERRPDDGPAGEAGEHSAEPRADEGGALAVALRSEDESAPDTAVPRDEAGLATDTGDEAGPAADVGSDPGSDPGAQALRQRDEALTSIERALGRRLKRVLADEQNEVLDLLRRGGPVELADVVPSADDHVERYAAAAADDLSAAAALGAALAGHHEAPPCDALAVTVARTLVDPLRVRIERSFVEGDGDVDEVTERLRALYREWKGNHIGQAVRHFTVSAHARGVYESVPEGAALRWLVDASCHACPDCDDNALAGHVGRGEAFPTGDTCSPAHPDCRCLVVPASALGEG